MTVCKKSILEFFLKAGDTLVTISVNEPGVDIPVFLKSNMTINFVFGNSSTPKLELSDKGVLASMRFGSARYVCRFPWESVIQMSTTDAVVQFSNTDKKKDSSVSNVINYDSTRKKANLKVLD